MRDIPKLHVEDRAEIRRLQGCGQRSYAPPLAYGGQAGVFLVSMWDARGWLAGLMGLSEADLAVRSIAVARARMGARGGCQAQD